MGIEAYPAWLWSGRRGVVSGLAASALHGAKWVEPGNFTELVHSNRRPPRGIITRGDRLLDDEVQFVGGIPVTTPARTGFDLGRRFGLDQAVERVDALMNATDVKAEEIDAVIARHRRVRGLRNLRTTLTLVDGGAESPYETKTRLLLARNGFPRPETQIRILDGDDNQPQRFLDRVSAALLAKGCPRTW